MAAVANEGTRMTTSTATPRRRSLAWTMALVAVIAADLAAFRAYLPIIPNPGLVLMIVVLEFGLFRVASRRGEDRAFWIGFEAAGWLYVLMCSIFARTAWRLARTLFERILLGRPVGGPAEMNQFLLFAGGLQLVIALAIALGCGLLTRAWWRSRAGVAPVIPD
jgi:hypothetical protein